MSSYKTRGSISLTGTIVLAVAGLLVALPAGAQYPGQVAKNSKENPELRSIAVLEWTGEAGSPKASRLVPVAVLDAGKLQDGSIYLARPEPLALGTEVEYELQQDGKAFGLFEIKNTGQEQGAWVGYGSWKPMPAAKPKPSQQELARTRIEDDDAQSDTPVLHRKHHADEAPAGGTAGGGSSSPTEPASDPERPTLHKKDSSGSTGDTSTSSTTSDTTADSGGPVLHKKDTSGSASDSSNTTSNSSQTSDTTADSDRPVMKKAKKKPEDIGHVDSLADVTDPDRPRLKRGKSPGYNLNVVPSLLGLPPDMQQAVAVSDARTHPEHPWTYSWSNPDDEAKMKSALEDMARDALSLNAPPPPPPPAPKKTAAKKAAKPAPPPPPPAPAPLADETFRVFELAYGSGATLVLTAHTDGPLAHQKFVTLVAQPDLYGNVLVLLKSVTDGAHLDETPRMRLVDAVDAMADNRGELLFELRGETQRQFAIYRILRGQAQKLFVTGGGDIGIEASP
jgi:hypothetical protein